MSSGALNRYGRGTLATEIAVFLLSIVFISPLFLLVAISLKTTQQAYVSTFGFTFPPNWKSYVDAFVGGIGGSGSIGVALVNSILVTAGTVVLLIVIGSVTAYVLARHQTRWSKGMYLFFALGVIMPVQLGLIPLYTTMRSLGLTRSLGGLALLEAFMMMPVVVFLYYGFIRALPRDYEEAAQVDGAGWFRTYRSVVFPLLRPITGSTAILTGLLCWNDFFTQLVFLGGGQQTVPVAIYTLASASVAKWNVIFAGLLISIVPILGFFVFAQRTMVRGFTGGIRG